VGPDLTIVIVTYNSIKVIDDLLDSLPAALDGLTCDVILVDNGSADGTADHAAARGGCRVIRSANVGYAGGINRGVQEAVSAEAILVLNPDVRLGEKSVPPLLASLRETGAGVAVPQIRSPSGELDLSLRREPTLLRALGLGWTGLPIFAETVTNPGEYSTRREVDWAVGAVLLMSRKCYDTMGGWDESYFLYSEETDFCLRARDAGVATRYEPASVAVHIGGQSGRGARTHTMLVLNRMRLYRRRHGPLASCCYFWLTVLGELSWRARGHRDSWPAIKAALRPSRRPAELSCGRSLVPR
jgi:N-acetylglucosaminyl-diphospho-decaprenol L-rhamnosyltransferase